MASLAEVCPLLSLMIFSRCATYWSNCRMRRAVQGSGTPALLTFPTRSIATTSWQSSSTSAFKSSALQFAVGR
ncbi:hypothetical protein EMIT0P294_50134 [Pseudomonas sp. IT-P294]